MGKRANGEGSVRQRPNGLWEGRVSYVDPTTDKRKSVSVYAATAAECRKELKKVQKRVGDGQPAKDSPDTVALWLQRWRESSLEASDRKATTKSLYSSISCKHLEGGSIGAKRLDRLKPSDVEKMIVDLRAKKLADSTVRQVYTVLRQALDVAVRDGLLATNPVAKVKRPGVTLKEAKHLSGADVVKLLDAARPLRYHAAVVLMAATGMRRGEVCGLSWNDVDLAKGELRVRHTLTRVDGALVLDTVKTDRSCRRMPLHAGIVSLLKVWRKQQVEERLAAGDQWTDTGMVFCTEGGKMVDPRNLLRTVQIAAKRAGIEKVGAHTMRHSAAASWLESGVHIKAVSDLLGHSSISITGDLYGHTSDDTARAEVESLGTALGL